MNIVPLAPEAANLGKFQTTPVGYYTGIPSISIPLFIANGRNISFPISLNYHGGGIKVEEIASMVGLGWTISTASVSRQVRHIPDDFSNGFLNSSYKPSSFQAGLGSSDPYKHIADALALRTDTEPDIFSFSFNGFSGEFFFDEQGEYHFKSHQDLKIELVRSSNGASIGGWIFTTPDGVQYFFGISRDKGRIASESLETIIIGDQRTDPALIGVSSWYLLDIVDGNKTDEIKFFYKDYISTICTNGTETSIGNNGGGEICDNPPGVGYSSSLVRASGTHRLIDSIATSNGAIKFAKKTPRLDFVGSNRLDKLIIYNSFGEIIKGFDFTYSYFIASGNSFADGGCQVNLDAQMKRLKLDALTETNGAGGSQPPYKFRYNGMALPSRLSKAVDYWGYYNGRNENAILIPAMMLLINGRYVAVAGANRNVYPSYSQAAVLDRIDYPTGGYTSYTYEQNKAATSIFYMLPALKERRYMWMQDTNVPSKSMEITIDDHEFGFVDVDYSFDRTPDCKPNTRGCDLFFQIQGLGDRSSFFVEWRLWSGKVRLENGRYKVTVFDAFPDHYYERFNLLWNQTPVQEQNQGYSGGLRIAQIVDNPDDIGEATYTKYRYNMFGNLNSTSGRLTSYPISGYQNNDVYCGCPLIVRTSVSNYPLSTTQGGYVGYMNVTEIHGINGEYGRTEMEFSFSPDDDAAAFEYPFPPPNSFEITRGDMLNKRVYNSDGILVRQEELNYVRKSGSLDPYYANVFGYKVASSRGGSCYRRYNTTGNWKLLDYQITKNYQKGSWIIDTVFYKYDNVGAHVMPTRMISTGSDGVKVTTQRNYPSDAIGRFTYSMDGSLLEAKNSLTSRFQINRPLEEIVFRGGTAVNKVRRDFALDGTKIYPKATWAAADGTLYFQTVSVDQVDSYGNIRQLTRNTAAAETYVWSSDGTEMLATFTNAKTDQVYYEGFENIGTQGDAKTGAHYYAGGSYSIPGNSRPAGSDLVMTFWYYDGSWKLASERPFNPNVTVPGATRIDEIRVYPVGATAKTFAYKSGIGLSSVTDENLQTTYYIYDELNRLRMLRDDRRNILQTFKYHYNVYVGK